MNQLSDAHSSSYILHPNIHQANPKVISARGNYITLESGQRILDATGGPAVACIGHGNVQVREAVTTQMDQFSFCHGLSYSNSAAEDLAREVIDTTNGAMTRVTIMCSGSDAIEAAIKLARQYFVEIKQPNRVRLIARRRCFHGTTLGSLSLTDKAGVRRSFEPLLMANHVSYVSTPNLYREIDDSENTKDYVQRLATELEDEFQRVGPHTVCGFVAETFTGTSSGCLAAPPGYFPTMRSICDKYGALLILDEVICGMGRTGTHHAWQQEGVTPDIQAVAKGLGGGYAAIAMLLMNQRIVDGLDSGAGLMAFNHGHTYDSHPVACAAALEVQNIIKRDNLIPNVVAMGKRLGMGLKSALSQHPHVGDIRGRGLLWAIEFVKNKETKEPFPVTAGVARSIRRTGMQEPHNISLYPGSGTVDGVAGDHVLIAPAYNITAEEIDQIVSLTTNAVQAVLGHDRASETL